MAASSLLESDCYVGARYRYLRRQLRTHKSANKATHYLAKLVYRMLTKGEAWVDCGTAQFERRRTEGEMASLTVRAR
jgi:hypothetical protein